MDWWISLSWALTAFVFICYFHIFRLWTGRRVAIGGLSWALTALVFIIVRDGIPSDADYNSTRVGVVVVVVVVVVVMTFLQWDNLRTL